MRSLLALCAVGFIFSGCSTSSSPQNERTGARIAGKVKFPQAGAMIKLEMLGDEGMQVIDTLELASDSTFQTQVDINEPAFLRLNFFGKQVVPLVVSGNDVDIFVEAEAYSAQAPVKVSGSVDTEFFEKAGRMNAKFQSDVQLLNNEYVQAMTSGNTEAASKLREQYRKVELDFNRDMKSLIWSMGNSVSAIFALNYLDSENQFPFMDSLAIRFKSELPHSRFTGELVERVESMRRLAVGSEAPEIRLPNPEGQEISLSSLRGKYVLIDFWAAWCRPCREENPNVLASYLKYKDKGFEILGVSLDRTKEAWVKAIEDDGLIWKHVSDLQYFNSEAAQSYQINAIPATYLIGPDGKIVGKNLRGESLNQKLAEIFG